WRPDRGRGAGPRRRANGHPAAHRQAAAARDDPPDLQREAAAGGGAAAAAVRRAAAAAPGDAAPAGPRGGAVGRRAGSPAPPAMIWDVAICGGGPAGLAAAIHSARAGFSTVVLERAPGPPDKACGEGLMPRGLE